MKHYFLNLTNGIERLPELQGEKVSFVRIRSTTVERKDWHYLLNDLDHNFLLHLALGQECVFVDYGTNRKNSKTCYMAVPLIKYILTRRWLGREEKGYRLGRQSDEKFFDVQYLFGHIYDRLFVFDQNNDKIKLKRKLDYYKRFVNTDTLRLETLCESTSNDGKYQYYANILKNEMS